MNSKRQVKVNLVKWYKFTFAVNAMVNFSINDKFDNYRTL